MPVIQVKTAVVAGADGAWVSTDGNSNFVVGVSGGDNWIIEYDLGSDIIYGKSGGSGPTNQSVVIAKANQVRVLNRGQEDLNYEVFG